MSTPAWRKKPIRYDSELRVRLPAKLHRRVRVEAGRLGIPVSELLRRYLEAGLCSR